MQEIRMGSEAQLQPLYDILRSLTSQPECATCRRCEEHVGLVYLLGDEADRVRDRSLPIVASSEGSRYLLRTRDGWCAAFNHVANTCRIYTARPLCCRLYPLDLMWLDGSLWWVIHIECPIAQRLQRIRHFELLIAITVAIENALSDEQLRAWRVTDRTSQRIEAFSSSEPKVLKLRLYGTPLAFP
jgi:Fe-S-cluster containining protein